MVRGLSWDILAGGVPTSGALLQVEAGFSGLPRVAYHYSLRRGLSVGGLVGFDYGFWNPKKQFQESLVLAAPIRWTIHRDAEWSVGFRGEPGVVLGFRDGFAFGLLAHIAGHVGYTLENRIIVGAGLEAPILLSIPSGGGRSTVFAVPILAGPIVEFHVTPPLAITADVKAGPYLSTEGTRFGLKLMIGAAYRL